MTSASVSGRVEVGGHLAQDVRDADGDQQQADERDQQPALHADARASATGAGSSLELAVEHDTGPKSRSRSHVASSSEITIERWKPPVHPIAIVSRVLPSSTYAGTSRSRRSWSWARNGMAIGWLRTNRADVLGQAGRRPQGLDVERVAHEPDVEHEVGLERDAVLEPEADQLDGRAGRSSGRRPGGRRSARAARAARARSCRAPRRRRRARSPAGRARARSRRRSPARPPAGGGAASPRSAGSGRRRGPRGR